MNNPKNKETEFKLVRIFPHVCMLAFMWMPVAHMGLSKFYEEELFCKENFEKQVQLSEMSPSNQKMCKGYYEDFKKDN